MANLSIGGLFVAGLAGRTDGIGPYRGVHHLGKRPVSAEEIELQMSGLERRHRLVRIDLRDLCGFQSGFATATEISAFAAVYAIVIGSIECSANSASRRRRPASCRRRRAPGWFCLSSLPRNRALSSYPAASPACGGRHDASLSSAHGTWLFMLLSIVVLIVMGSVLRRRGADHLWAAAASGCDQARHRPLHFGVVLVISMGLGLFARRSGSDFTEPA